MLWPANSPDLNMIEPCWAHLKRKTTRKGALTSAAIAKKVWTREWMKLEQWRIQSWIARIYRHVQEVFRVEDGKDYREGAFDKPRDFRAILRYAQKRPSLETGCKG